MLPYICEVTSRSQAQVEGLQTESEKTQQELLATKSQCSRLETTAVESCKALHTARHCDASQSQSLQESAEKNSKYEAQLRVRITVTQLQFQIGKLTVAQCVKLMPYC